MRQDLLEAFRQALTSNVLFEKFFHSHKNGKIGEASYISQNTVGLGQKILNKYPTYVIKM